MEDINRADRKESRTASDRFGNTRTVYSAGRALITKKSLLKQYGWQMPCGKVIVSDIEQRGMDLTDLTKKQPGTKDLDQLTGLLKKDVVEAQIGFRMKEKGGGTLFLCDVDYLERINEKYGHLAGDECLKQVAQVLSYMIRPADILGRRGGDEFVIFMPNCRESRQAEEMCSRIEKRFRANGRQGQDRIPFSVTVVWALWQPGDTGRKVFERADAELKKQEKVLAIHGGKKDHYIKDVGRVRNELIEQIQKPGAYCRDYETFKSIYRFLERGIIRSGQKACVILITVVNEKGGSLLPNEKDIMMVRLGKDIETTLRIGDVYTRYSSSQYLALVIDTTEGQADSIVNRIRSQFLRSGNGNNILIHNCYELQPAQIGEQSD